MTTSNGLLFSFYVFRVVTGMIGLFMLIVSAIDSNRNGCFGNKEQKKLRMGLLFILVGPFYAVGWIIWMAFRKL